MTIIVAYVPTDVTDYPTKNAFFDKLHEVVQNAPPLDITVILLHSHQCCILLHSHQFDAPHAALKPCQQLEHFCGLMYQHQRQTS